MQEEDRRTQIIDFEVTLTKKELAEYAAEAAELSAQEDDIETQRKAAAAGFKARLDDCNAQIKRLLRAVKTGVEMKTGECEVHYDYDSATVNYLSLELSKIVYSRAMTYEERQLNLLDLHKEPEE